MSLPWPTHTYSGNAAKSLESQSNEPQPITDQLRMTDTGADNEFAERSAIPGPSEWPLFVWIWVISAVSTAVLATVSAVAAVLDTTQLMKASAALAFMFLVFTVESGVACASNAGEIRGKKRFPDGKAVRYAGLVFSAIAFVALFAQLMNAAADASPFAMVIVVLYAVFIVRETVQGP